MSVLSLIYVVDDGRKDLRVPIEVKGNTVLAWSFTTIHHDIGFSITYDDAEVCAYQRYNSHERPVRGFLDIPNTGVVYLIWDNTFSKWRSKTLNYAFKLVDHQQYDKAKVKAVEIRSKKIHYHKQRIILKKLLTKLSNELLISTNPSKTLSILRSTITDLTEDLGEVDATSLKYISGEDVDIKGLVRQVEQLKNEKKCLQQALSESEAALVSERTACAENVRNFETLTMTKDALEEELCEVRNELDGLKVEYQDFITSSQKDLLGKFYPIEVLLQLSEDEATRKGNAIANFPQLLDYAKEVTSHLLEAREKMAAMEQMLSKFKNEKKQLKAFGIQSKERIDILEKEIQNVEHDRDMVNRENASLKNRIEVLEKTIMQYREDIAKKELESYGGASAVMEEESEYDSRQEDVNGSTASNNAAVLRARSLQMTSREEEDAMLAADDDYEEEDDGDRPPKIIVYDFASAEPDEMSQALEIMAESIQNMLPSWDQIMGSNHSTSSSKSSQSNFFSFGF